MGNVLKINEINKLSGLEHTVFHGPTFAFYKSELHRRIFIEWKAFWEQHFEETHSSAKLFSDELSRTTYVLVLHKKEIPIGILFSSLWNLANPVHQHSRYISQYPEQAREKFLQYNFTNVLSLEYLTIHADWRFQKTQLPLSEVLLGLGLKIFHRNDELDGVISIARRVVKVQDRMACWGMKELTHMTLHNNACTVTACSRNDYKVENPDSRINELTNHFLETQKQIGFPEFSLYQRRNGLKAA